MDILLKPVLVLVQLGSAVPRERERERERESECQQSCFAYLHTVTQTENTVKLLILACN